MSVLIKGLFGKDMPMPQEGYVDIRLHFKGGRIECATMPIGNPPYYATFKAVELPPHGRLGDLDELWDRMYKYSDNEGAKMPFGDNDSMIHRDSACELIENAPTVIEGSETE